MPGIYRTQSFAFPVKCSNHSATIPLCIMEGHLKYALPCHIKIQFSPRRWCISCMLNYKIPFKKLGSKMMKTTSNTLICNYFQVTGLSKVLILHYYIVHNIWLIFCASIQRYMLVYIHVKRFYKWKADDTLTIDFHTKTHYTFVKDYSCLDVQSNTSRIAHRF